MTILLGDKTGTTDTTYSIKGKLLEAAKDK